MGEDGAKKSEMEELEKSTQEQWQKLQAEKTTATTVQKTKADVDWWDTHDAMTISAAVLIFGSVIMLLATSLLFKGRNADDVLKLFGTVIIVIFAAFLVVAGYTDTQIAPVIGLLGTIAGYLLGSKSTEDEVAKAIEIAMLKKKMEEEHK